MNQRKSLAACVAVMLGAFAPAISNGETKEATAETFRTGLVAFFAQDFAAAVGRFREALDAFPEDRAAALYLGRAAALVVSGADEDWDGVERLDEKRILVDLAHINRPGFFDAVDFDLI